jgi:prefoldin subunit 5
MPKKVEPSEKKVLVSIKMGLLHDLMQISEDINTSIEYLFNQNQKREEAWIFQNDIVGKLANRIELIEKAWSKIKTNEEVEINKQILERQLEEAKEILQQHLDYLNRNAKVKQ